VEDIVKLSIFLLLFIGWNATIYATDVSGPVSGTWTVEGNPYNVVGPIGIQAGETLMIEPGVQVIFQGWYKFLVYGSLQAVGTETDSITFTAADTTEGWHGLRFYDISTQADSSFLVYCSIQYGRSSGDNSAGEDKHGGAIYCSNSSKLRIQNCSILHNQTSDIAGANGIAGNPGTSGESAATGDGGAIYLLNSDLIISSNAICENQTGSASGGNGGAGAYSTSNSGADGGPGGAAASGRGGAIYCENSNPLILDNLFSFNKTGNAIGGEGGHGQNMTYGGMFGPSGGDGSFGADAESGNGGAIYCINSELVFSNNIFVDNNTGDALGGDGGGGGNATVTSGNNSWGGDGGDGGNAYGGAGGCLYLYCTIVTGSDNLLKGNTSGNIIAGSGGDGGNAINGIPNGGDGGDGGDACGGGGACIYEAEGSLNLDNCTIVSSITGTGTPGTGGAGGAGGPGGWSGSPGDPGVSGISYYNEGVIYSSGTPPQIKNSIIWDSNDQSISGNAQVSYSCIQGGWPGIGNFDENPLFVDPENEDFHLQSLTGSYHNGQWYPDISHSPCIDAGDPTSNYMNEPEPNGERINIGVYGNTIEASLSADFVGIEGPVSGVWTLEEAHFLSPVTFGSHPIQTWCWSPVYR
jgi:hypothetical protein